MPEAALYTAAAARKGSFALPEEFDGVVHEAVLHQTVRAFLNNQRQGTHATKTRGLVSGGNQKPWRQKGTGRARQGSIRAPHWPGGGTVFGPQPRSYRTEVPRKMRRLARRSALNARANAGAIHVIEALAFEKPKTSEMVGLLDKLELAGRKVLVLTEATQPAIYLSARNIPGVRVMRYQDASAYDLLWADALLVEEAAIGGGHEVARPSRQPVARAKRAKRAEAAAPKKRPARKAAKPKTAAKPTRARTQGGKKPAKASKKKEGGDA